jgi:hypothetical protein
MKFMIIIAKKVLNLLITILQGNNDRTKIHNANQNQSYLITNKNNRGQLMKKQVEDNLACVASVWIGGQVLTLGQNEDIPKSC